MSTDPIIAGPGKDIAGLLEAGHDVILTAELPSPATVIAEACRRGGTTVYSATVAGAFMIERIAMTMIQGMDHVWHLEVTITEPGDPCYAATIDNVANTVFGDRDIRIEREPHVHRAYRAEQHFLTITHDRREGPFAPFNTSRGYAIRVSGEPADLNAQWEIDGTIDATALIADAIPAVGRADPGILVDDPTPRYRLDDRVR
ncbi:hypothetical protein [Mycobacteroides abscessus]|uniref:Uncharacterized conserved protein related to dihydrodipicolinate reductase n=1 Tax=Mycobacteroides abscessus TaxID=36809 RepID=A0A0U0ZRJ2_9MYCO|nr:hypothetical protein [Mycobacteroides abscessus]MBL3733890.1 hypothetical protein [Mycobacteroides abscessus subsp. massiliense]MBL3745099.1 hypothetical protein [Mycobacteroides abscessus subsp. massiliense]MBL3760584.1 hypothetical protein [Mycobacteroides abscessus subsp. massiliense]MBN7481517.1 hypothetical protein [Mycobacteroides abscessus subsp. massiliense]MDB2217016.1 hypothetical protein [Mycobacteroides abscessus subsp. massiliense]